LDRVPADVRDNAVVETALEADVETIVSDDDDLLSLKVILVPGFRAVQVHAPGPFLRSVRAGT
jgi:predicted nucleic acid-binding protein